MIHRQPAAEDPHQHDRRAAQAESVVPAQHATKCRPAGPLAHADLPCAVQAEQGSGHRADQGGQRHPPHRAIPGAEVVAQHGEIQPVRNRAQPIPAPFAGAGALHHLAAAGGHVQLGPCGIVQLDAVKRTPGIEMLVHAPLVHLQWPDQPAHPCMGEARSDLACLCAVEQAEQDSAVRIDAAHRDGAIDHIARLPGDRDQAHAVAAAAGRQGHGRRDLDLCQHQRFAPGATGAIGQGGERHEQHHDAAAEPHHKRQAHCDPEPPMQPCQMRP
ncbi:hypothetical protein [Xanthomonas prunicola]|uniref:hypothetical protein n=1 Tax=Xanthomonas prunicola TaxID=2053930 RepID=UPI003CE472AA